MRFRFSIQSSAFAMMAGTLPLISSTEPDYVYGFTVETQIAPGGRPCTWFVEYGATEAYGTTTSLRELAPRLAAHYKESFNTDLAGFQGSVDAMGLSWNAGGFATWNPASAGSNDDANHVSGLRALGFTGEGLLWLPIYIHHGSNEAPGPPLARLGGGFPDFRGARLSAKVRGNAWVNSAGATLRTWIQAPNDADKTSPGLNAMNWYHAGAGSVWDTAVAAGTWQTVEVTLRNRRADWAYAGRNDDHAIQRYWYGELDGSFWDPGAQEGGGGGGVLGNMYDDIFVVQCIGVTGTRPTGSIDFDDITFTYRNHNVCLASNGGTLAVSPTGGTGTEYLTDGWRNVAAGGAGEWQSSATPAFPLDFEYTFADSVTLYAFQIHNSTTNPSDGIEVHVSEDDGGTWTTIYTGTLPNVANGNHNYCELRNAGGTYFAPIHANPVNRVRVRVTSAVGAQAGLGEIEFFGTGAKKQTEPGETYDVNRDILVAPGTYHYRVGYTIDGVTTYSSDHVAVVPQLLPSLSYVSPETVPAGGGVVTLYGENLSDGTPVVDFQPGGAPSATDGVARGRLKITVPAVTQGDLAPRVTTAGGATSRRRLFAYTMSATSVAQGGSFTITGGDYSTVTNAFVGGVPAAFTVAAGGNAITLTVDPITPTGDQPFILWDPNDVPDGVIYFYDGADPPNQRTITVEAQALFMGIAGSGGSDTDAFWSFPTHARIDYFAAKGFTCMRIPFRWERIQPTPGGALDTTHKNLLDDRVRYCVSKGMKVMVVPHNFGGRAADGNVNGTQLKIGGGTITRAHFADLWGKLAALWADLSESVIFDLMNEPESMPADVYADGTYALAAAYNDAIVAIRAAGATNLVALEGNGFNNAKSFNTDAWYGTANGAVFASTIVDSGDNWCVSVHNYPDVGHGDEGDAINATILRTQMTNVIDWCAANGKKCIVGEFSATVSDPNGEAVIADFVSYLNANLSHVIGWSWWEGRSSADTTSLYNIADDVGTDDVRLGWLGL